jgi:uncharacterized hydrophobic protein (TIGR00271 family)
MKEESNAEQAWERTNPQGSKNPDGINPEDLKQGLYSIGKFVKGIIRLDEGVDKLATIQEIKNKKSLAGANAWMLMCSIMIASVGLDLNSPAVIIGGMLISPLMSPILGIGLAIGINDKETLKQSLWHFSTAIVIAIVTSTMYFLLSPFGQITDEIASRLEPTFLDVIIALFGGIAGIVSVARKDLSTTLPGVAIATALMPPLCVTGFGIANWDWSITSHSFYLFFLNTVFVALATYLIIRFLDFPHRDYVNAAERKKARMYLALFTLLVIIPSFIIFRRVWIKHKNQIKLETFVDNYIAEDKIYLDDYQLIPSDTVNTVLLKVYGTEIGQSRIPELERGLGLVGLKNTEIKIISTSEIKLDALKTLEQQVNGMSKIANQLEAANEERVDQSQRIQQLEKQLEILAIDTTTYLQIREQLLVLIPEVKDIALGFGQIKSGGKAKEGVPLVIVDWKKDIDNKDEILERIKNYIEVSLGKSGCLVVDRRPKSTEQEVMIFDTNFE